MPALWSPEDLAARFAPYIEELHDVFTMHGLSYGSPQDIRTMAVSLESPGPVNEEVSSLVRSMVLREGGSIPRTDLLEILAIAIAGPGMDAAGEELQQPVRQLLSFLHSALRRPWNEPAGEDRLHTPTEDEMRAQAARELREAAAKIEAETRSGSAAAVDGHPSLGELYAQAAANPRATIIPFGRARAVFSKLAREDAAEPTEGVAQAEALEPAQPALETAPQETGNLPASTEAAVHDIPAAPSDRPSHSVPHNAHPIAVAGILPEFDDEPPLPASPRLTRGTLISGLAAAALAIAVLGVALHAGPGAGPIVAASQAMPARALQLSPAVAPQTSQAVSVTPAKPSPSRSHFDDDYVAAPYSSMPLEKGSSAQPADASASGTSAAQAATQVSKLSAPTSSTTADPGLHPTALEQPPLHPRVPAAVMALNLITAPKPDYPLLAKLAHVDGPVIIHAEIGRGGSVVDTEVVSGHHLLRHAAEDAVRHWRYHPYEVDGKAVPVSTTITVRFRH